MLQMLRWIAAAAGVLLLVVLVPLDVIAQRTPPLERFLMGRWLVRPVHPENWVQPYTHEAHFTASSTFDGDVLASVTPFYGVDTATGYLATLTQWTGDAIGPMFYRFVAEVLALVAMATGTSPTVVGARMNHSDSESSFSLWNRCSASAPDGPLNAVLRNASFSFRLNMESNVLGALTLDWSNPHCVDATRAADETQPTASATVAYPVSVHHAPTDNQKYRTITSTTNAHRASVRKCLDIPRMMPDGTCGMQQTPIAVSSFSAHVLDDSSTMVHLVIATQLSCEETQEEQTTLCPITLILKRMTPSDEGRELGSTIWTLGLLVLVALVKFGPRQYMRWKGISPNTFVGGTLAKKNLGRDEALAQHAEILQTAKVRK
jgi:hypothetical protein